MGADAASNVSSLLSAFDEPPNPVPGQPPAAAPQPQAAAPPQPPPQRPVPPAAPPAAAAPAEGPAPAAAPAEGEVPPAALAPEPLADPDDLKFSWEQDGEPAEPAAVPAAAPPDGAEPDKPRRSDSEIEAEFNELYPFLADDPEKAKRAETLLLSHSRGQRMLQSLKAVRPLAEQLGHIPSAEELTDLDKRAFSFQMLDDDLHSEDPARVKKALNFWIGGNPTENVPPPTERIAVISALPDYLAESGDRDGYIALEDNVITRLVSTVNEQADQETRPEIKQGLKRLSQLASWYIGKGQLASAQPGANGSAAAIDPSQPAAAAESPRADPVRLAEQQELERLRRQNRDHQTAQLNQFAGSINSNMMEAVQGIAEETLSSKVAPIKELYKHDPLAYQGHKVEFVKQVITALQSDERAMTQFDSLYARAVRAAQNGDMTLAREAAAAAVAFYRNRAGLTAKRAIIGFRDKHLVPHLNGSAQQVRDRAQSRETAEGKTSVVPQGSSVSPVTATPKALEPKPGETSRDFNTRVLLSQ